MVNHLRGKRWKFQFTHGKMDANPPIQAIGKGILFIKTQGIFFGRSGMNLEAGEL